MNYTESNVINSRGSLLAKTKNFILASKEPLLLTKKIYFFTKKLIIYTQKKASAIMTTSNILYRAPWSYLFYKWSHLTK